MLKRDQHGNGRSMIVRVNDRGPFHGNRVIDLSERVADMLGTKDNGVGKVKVEYVGRARIDGLDEEYLMASYRGPGATTPGGTLPGTQFAQAPVFGPAHAPAPRPYGRVLQVASAGYSQGAPAGTFDPALAFEADGATVKVASANTFRPSPVSGPVTAPAYQPQPAGYVAPQPSNQPGVLGTMRVPAAGTPRSLIPGSAVSSFAADRRIEAAHAVTAQMATGSIPLSRLAGR
jgi:rare lipoprotein A